MITARARKNKRSARMLAIARKDDLIPLMWKTSINTKIILPNIFPTNFSLGDSKNRDFTF